MIPSTTVDPVVDPETAYAIAKVNWAANLLADFFNGKILDYEGEVP